MLRTARKGFAASRKFFLQQAEHTMAHEIARITLVTIALVFDPAQRMVLRVIQQFCTGNIQQGADHDTVGLLSRQRHGTRAAHARAAQKLQQQGLRLVVGVVRQRNESAILFSQCGMAQLACGRLDAEPFAQGLDIDLRHFALDVVPRA